MFMMLPGLCSGPLPTKGSLLLAALFVLLSSSQDLQQVEHVSSLPHPPPFPQLTHFSGKGKSTRTGLSGSMLWMGPNVISGQHWVHWVGARDLLSKGNSPQGSQKLSTQAGQLSMMIETLPDHGWPSRAWRKTCWQGTKL